jgi:hypothetical protein
MSSSVTVEAAVPTELNALSARLAELPAEIAEELRPAVEEAIEQARFRGRILDVAKEALERLRLELELTKFDLELTRKERDGLKAVAS